MDEKIKKTAIDFLSALDRAIESGSWDETNFILIIGKKLKKMRDELSEKIDAIEEHNELSQSFLSRKIAMENSLVEVFISLYSIDGIKIQSWEMIIYNLKRQIVSRPVYLKEEEVIAIIKTKEKKINEAYLSIFVKSEDILQIGLEKVAVDKLGQTLLVLKDNAIVLENINFFVHLSGKYRYSRGKLLSINND